MVQAKQVLEVLASRLNLTSLDEKQEEMILTPQEEELAVSHAIRMAKEHFQYRRLQLGEPLGVIEQKMADIHWIKEIDTVEVLRVANSNKHYEIWINNKREQEKQAKELERKELLERYTAKFVYNIMAWVSKNTYGKELIVHEGNKKLVTAICFFISNDERFETELGYSFKKGLLIRGISGLGKTYLFNCIKDNELKPLSIYSMIEITERIKEEGFLELPTNKFLYLDDVGTEEHTVNHYGTKISFFKNFIEKYYLQNKTYEKLIISTNNSFNELEEKYGFRVRSRMAQMFNIIDVTGSDMRKIN